MSEFDGIGRVTPGDRPHERARKLPPDREFPDEPDEENAEAEDDDGLPESVRRKRQEGRQIAPPAYHEEGQIIDILA